MKTITFSPQRQASIMEETLGDDVHAYLAAHATTWEPRNVERDNWDGSCIGQGIAITVTLTAEAITGYHALLRRMGDAE